MHSADACDSDLDQIFADITSTDAHSRENGAKQLNDYVLRQATSASNTTNSSNQRQDEISKRILVLVQSKNSRLRKGAILAIDVTLETIKEDPIGNRQNLFQFYNYLTALLRDSRDGDLDVTISQSLGRLTHFGGVVLGDRFVEEEIPNFLEEISSDSPSSHGVTLVLKELARNSPTSFFPHISDTFGIVSLLLRNAQGDIRQAAADLLGYVFSAMSTRDIETHQVAISSLLVRVQQGLKINSTAARHGSLLALRELFLHTGELMAEHFLDTCETVLWLRSHPDSSVRRAVITMVPTLAGYDSRTFCQHFMVTTMSFLLPNLDADDAPSAYLTIGHLSSAVGPELNPFIETIFLHVESALTMPSRQKTFLLKNIFEMIGLLATSLGTSIVQQVNDQLQLLSNCGLSEPLIQMFKVVVRHIPVLLKPIQSRLLDLVSLVLSGHPYRPLGSQQAPYQIASSSTPKHNIATVTLALSVLEIFNFEGHLLNEFVVTAVLPHLDDEGAPARKAAARTTCEILSRDPVRFQSSIHAGEVIATVFKKLLSVCVIDSDPSVRGAVLASLQSTLDYQLAQAEYIRLLVIALHDEVVENRILAVRVMGRLASHNPAQVFPSLRKTLIRLLTELRHSVTLRSKEEAIRLLAALIASTHAIVMNCIAEVLEVLFNCASDHNPVVTTHVLLCLGQLSAASPRDVGHQIPRVMPIVLMILERDIRSTTLSAALECLGQLCTNNGYVIKPIEDYPQLIPLLHRMLKRERTPEIRRQVIKVIGLLGAMDPYTYQVRVQGIIDMEFPPETIHAVPDTDSPRPSSSVVSDDPHQEMVVDLLVGILQQQALRSHHHLAVDSLMSIAKTRGLTFAPSVPKIMPAFCDAIRGSLPTLQGYYLAQLTILVRAIGQHVRTCITDIIDLVHGIWDASSQQLALVVLVEVLATVLTADFEPYVPRLIPRLLRILQDDRNDLVVAVRIQVLKALVAFASNLQEYLSLVVPIIILTYERSHAPFALRKQAILTLTGLSKSVDLYPYTSRIIHSLVHAMAIPDEELRQVISDALCTLAHGLGPSFALFVPVVTKALVDNHSFPEKLVDVLSRISSGEPLPQLDATPRMMESSPKGAILSPNQFLLKRAWDVSHVQDSHDAWLEWFTHLAAQFVKESPSISLRACMNLFDAYAHVSMKLFNPAVASCWNHLSEAHQEDFIRSMEHVVASSSVLPEVAHSMLNLVEYMERNSTPLPISNASVANYCFSQKAYAKALHYRELHFFQEPSPSTIDALIEINAMLRQGDAALGTLTLARQHYTVENPQIWYEKLGQWNSALQLYEAMDGQDSRDPQNLDSQTSFIGRLRCLHALGDWEQLAALIAQKWPNSDRQLQAQIAAHGAVGAWHTGEWESLERYCSAMDLDSGDRAFYRAVSSVHRRRLPRAYANILKARDLLDPELTSLLDESPDRLARFAVQAQMVSELEEVLLYKSSADRPDRQQALRETWKRRLLGCQRDLNVWQRVIKVRTLAITTEENIDTLVQFVNLCRKSGRLSAAQRVMQGLVHPGVHGDKAPPQVVYAQLKMLWASGDRNTAISSLRRFVEEIIQHPPPDDQTTAVTVKHLLARCHLKYGNWRAEIDGGIILSNTSTILHYYHLATEYDPQWSKAWHTWALSNLDIVRNSPVVTSAGEVHPIVDRASHIVAAIEGFFHSIQLKNRDALQDSLRLLTLWFKFGAHSEITFAMTKGFESVSCDTWLEVVPQIIARIQTPNLVIRDALIKLLTDIGREHPQALIYPLTVGAKSPSKPRKAVALRILDHMRAHSWTLVEQAKLVGQELSRVAISWAEFWHEGLQKSARYYINGSPAAMLLSLKPLYDLLDQGPSTLAEKEFSDTLGPVLQQARQLCQRHIAEGNQQAFDQAWNIFFQVWQRLDKHLPEIEAPRRQRDPKTLDLQFTSPQLHCAANMDLAVPGTYISGRSVIKISGFKREIPVLKTKQGPRRLVIKGDNGQQFVFLLKGHEDLRQDERVMQVVGLVNKLLSRDRECLNRRLHLQRYPVIPLAPDVGLLAWMASTDTLHSLISDYRTSHKILVDLEHRMTLQEEPEYETSTNLARKVEVFKSVMERTTGQDLYRILWLKSDSSEAWVNRRTTYTRSLAVGSMVGYLLGVGDRHPANIMVSRKTGKVIHIDFGDCFEVAIERDKLPEKVPFRLTRMLRHAMEVCGIQGGFKTSCEISMVVLRENKESLLAVLEAFVYDPLINWRLVRNDSETSAEVPSSLGSTDEGPTRRAVLNENEILDDVDASETTREVRNERALGVYNRVEDKLTGRDFGPDRILPVPEQVERLIQQATSPENLCEHFHGWCPTW